LDFRHIHIYRDDSAPNLDEESVAQDVGKLFPSCRVDVRQPFFKHWTVTFEDQAGIVESAKIFDTKQPFERQPRNAGYKDGEISLYDGFVLQSRIRQMISESESRIQHVHIVFTDLLTCTFSEEDWRYHARAIICGSPAIISSTGIIEGPAKPREFYLLAHPGAKDAANLEKEFAGGFIGYGDERISAAATGLALQALFFFISAGEPFCESSDCRLFNSHWQEDLIRTQVQRPAICRRHKEELNKLNRNNSHL
jgi:hypothetical protein